MVKDPAFKGSFQAHYPPGTEGRSTTTKTVPNQEKTSNYQTAKLSRDSKGTGYGKHEEGDPAIIYDTYDSTVPVYVTINYDITLRSEYQQQMNTMTHPFGTRPGGANHVVLRHNKRKFEAFIGQDFASDNTVADIGEGERNFQTKIEIKVLAALIGHGDNQEKPKVVVRENAVDVKLMRERVILQDEAENTVDKKYRE